MREVTREQWIKMLAVNCNKGKHRFRTNNAGVTWCVICGLLSNKGTEILKEEDNLKIV